MQTLGGKRQVLQRSQYSLVLENWLPIACQFALIAFSPWPHLLKSLPRLQGGVEVYAAVRTVAVFLLGLLRLRAALQVLHQVVQLVPNLLLNRACITQCRGGV